MSRLSSHLVLFAGLVLVSTAAPFLVAARMDAFALAFWRMALSSILFATWASLRGELRLPAGFRREVFLGAALLAAHFALWIKAFELTDYASNLLLLVAQPVMAALVGSRLGEKPDRNVLISVVLAVLGLSIIARGDFDLGPRALLGDAISLVGSIAITLSYAVTRRSRSAVPLPSFLAFYMGSGAIWMLPVALVAGTNFVGSSPNSWFWLGLLVLVTTVGGHGLMNLAARHVRLFTLNLVIVLEPPLGVLMGWPLFGAKVTMTQLVGGAVLALAVAIGLRRSAPRTEPAPAVG